MTEAVITSLGVCPAPLRLVMSVTLSFAVHVTRDV